MLLKTEESINLIKELLKDKNFHKKLFSHTKSKEYIVRLFIKIEKIFQNYRSIELLLEGDFVEDSYTVFRKFLETYFMVFVNLSNPIIINRYLIHERYLTLKVIGHSLQEVKTFTNNKPDGFLEYGFIEELVDSKAIGFRYTIKAIAEVADQLKYYKWYKISSNFVHNNLNQVSINKVELKEKLLKMLGELLTNLYEILTK
jgi:hypothetical protein